MISSSSAGHLKLCLCTHFNISRTSHHKPQFVASLNTKCACYLSDKSSISDFSPRSDSNTVIKRVEVLLQIQYYSKGDLYMSTVAA